VRRSTVRDVRAAVSDESCRAVDALLLERAVAAQVRRVVPFDLWCGLTIDPATGNPTGGYHDEGLPAPRLPRLVELEHGADPDYAALRTLAAADVPVGTLDAATAGDPARSARYRDVLEPSGVRHEVRVVCRTGTGAWGALVFMRGSDEADFSPPELAVLRSLGPVVAEGLRRTTVLTSRSAEPADGPGLVLATVTDHIVIDHISDNARTWLAEIEDGVQDQLPYAVASLVHATRHQSHAYPDRRARLRTRSGRWLTLHATTLGHTTVSVIVEPTQAREVAALLLDAFRFTPRERQVAMLTVRGLSNDQIGAALFLSPHTVNDHLKSAFAKAGVNRRTELTAKLLFDHLGDLDR
jgi:DNA-binding CsgD family transcriptional regulator